MPRRLGAGLRIEAVSARPTGRSRSRPGTLPTCRRSDPWSHACIGIVGSVRAAAPLRLIKTYATRAGVDDAEICSIGDVLPARIDQA